MLTQDCTVKELRTTCTSAGLKRLVPASNNLEGAIVLAIISNDEYREYF